MLYNTENTWDSVWKNMWENQWMQLDPWSVVRCLLVEKHMFTYAHSWLNTNCLFIEWIVFTQNQAFCQLSRHDRILGNYFNIFCSLFSSILQVAKTSSVKDVIVQALAKNRKGSESERKSPEDYVLVEEIDVLDGLVLHIYPAVWFFFEEPYFT